MTPEWEIQKEEFLHRLGLDERDFERRLLLPDVRSVRRIVPLRYLAEIHSVVPMSHAMLFELIAKMTTLDGQRPFTRATIQMCRVDPNHLTIGQKFVYRENYQNILEEIPGLFGRFAIPSGLGDLGAYFIFGRDKDGAEALACYVPPLIEQHGTDLVIMDGIHRDYITKQLGATINAVLIKNVATPFPCGIRPWSDIRVIGLDEKPKDIRERYFDLAKELFRDLKYLGIDG